MKISEANKLRILYFLVFCCTASWLPIFADYCKEQGLSGIQDRDHFKHHSFYDVFGAAFLWHAG